MITKAQIAALKCEGIDLIQHWSLLFPQYCAPGCNAIITAVLNFKLDIISTKNKGYHAEKHQAKFSVYSFYQQTHCKPFLSVVPMLSQTCKVQIKIKIGTKEEKDEAKLDGAQSHTLRYFALDSQQQ